ncbi:fumarylacetoacetate hydrolase family protein [Mycobacterium riyadhense]|uniref:Fumarylacetoacetase n=1 Tax=Mycobacterium riyadhense TaxID=486698 RepID=A0A1X2CY85_9MYCO|nr:fumarylacetoacetate hydrolase family protein [Mycobacterium riyadhense]MCV7147973.1 fumarylacetoacetate hydrolase family protein [Mycobacterium riyadhense]ORW80885.1 fumarylacetoacetase [Mycobacterium riyadhense]VTP03877.1 Ureidoglycolate lyase [Mycobacterium riyadhense]
MTVSILRTADGWWVQTATGAARVSTDAATTRELLADRAAIDDAARSTDTVPIDSLELLSPVTLPCRVVAQAVNYASHVRDVGRDPAKTQLTFFRKASGSITGPFDDIVKPDHVQLLDYEVEIGLVIGRAVPVGTEVIDANLADFVCGLAVTNDVSARDVQQAKGQYYEAKSYPTFTPVGPALVLLDADELERFGELRVQLQVNGEERQNSVVKGDMIYPPVQALQALSRFQRLDAGDLILTGTPVGTAVRKPKDAPAGPPTLEGFLASQAQNPLYLHDGDVVEATVATDDGTINLGTQRNVVRYA